ncbi:unnamed protein product [Durusdinium trenchii]|uniref:Uncharacterized protein n=1 Tax=Durusdinium trenchii TaxID=1381693 RepID=A0ABP0RS52_9DINO
MNDWSSLLGCRPLTLLLEQFPSKPQEEMNTAEQALNRTRGSVQIHRQRLELVQKSMEELQAKSKILVADFATAENNIARQSTDLRTLQELARVDDADVAKAAQALVEAEADVTNAKAAYVGSTLADARRQCQPTEQEYQVYLHFRELVSLAKHIVVQRLLALQLADQFWVTQDHIFRDAQAAHETVLDDLADGAAELHERSVVLAAADTYSSSAEDQEQAFLEAQSHFIKSQEKVDEVLALRRKADFAASHQLSVYGKAAENLDLAKKHLHNRRMALEGATNQTDQLEKDLLAAIQAEAMANESLRATKVWQKEFNASLQLERKEETLVEAKHEEDKKAAAKAEVSKHEARMRTLLETHKRHLALLDTQVELPQKDKAKAEAKIAFDAAEKNVVEAQSKLDGLVKTEAETHVKISETYEELNRLKIEHTEAEREYQDQDPEDRKRSFTTSLQ